MLSSTVKSLEGLTPEFRDKVIRLVDNCASHGVIIVPYCGVRHPLEQAKLWRQSRTKKQVDDLIEILKYGKADYIRTCIEVVGPQPMSRWATSTPPGLSWHQWGEAVDCYVLGSNGEPEWNTSHIGYGLYAGEAKKLGLVSGYYWPHKDAVHVQLREARVLALYDWKHVSEAMRARFGDKLIDNSKVAA